MTYKFQTFVGMLDARYKRLRFQNGTARSNNLEAEIDEKVFDLYGLTPEEREIVKGGGK